MQLVCSASETERTSLHLGQTCSASSSPASLADRQRPAGMPLPLLAPVYEEIKRITSLHEVHLVRVPTGNEGQTRAISDGARELGQGWSHLPRIGGDVVYPELPGAVPLHSKQAIASIPAQRRSTFHLPAACSERHRSQCLPRVVAHIEPVELI